MGEDLFYYNLLNRTINEETFNLFYKKMKEFLSDSCIYNFKGNSFVSYDLENNKYFEIKIEGRVVKLKKVSKYEEYEDNIWLKELNDNTHILIFNHCNKINEHDENRSTIAKGYSYGVEMSKIKQEIMLHDGEVVETHKEKYVRSGMKVQTEINGEEYFVRNSHKKYIEEKKKFTRKKRVYEY